MRPLKAQGKLTCSAVRPATAIITSVLTDKLMMLRLSVLHAGMVVTTAYSLMPLGHRATAPARAARSVLMPLDDWAVEDCILAAENEDEVQTCMQMMDEINDAPPYVITALGECLSQAAHDAAAIDECVLGSDQSSEASYG